MFRGRGSRLVVASGAFTRGVRRVDGGVVASGAFTWDGQATAPTQRPPPDPHPMIARCKIIRGEREGETRAIAGRGRITGGMVTRMWCGRAGWGTYIFASALRGCVASSRVATRASAPVRVRHSVTGWRVVSPDWLRHGVMDSKFPVCPECASHSQPGRARTRARTSNDHPRRSPTTLVALTRGAAPDTKRRRRRTRGSPS